MGIKRYSLFAIFFPLLLGSCIRPSLPQTEFVLGTFCTVELREGGGKKAYSRIFARIREIDRTMTSFPGEFEGLLGDALVDPDGEEAKRIRAVEETLTSGVVAINNHAGVRPVKVRADLIELLQIALDFAEMSGGAFDPTIGPLVKLWGIGTPDQRLPDEQEIEYALSLVNWRDAVIDHEEQTVFLRRFGMELDLGAIAKGYAGDEALRIAKESKVKRAIFDLGGNIVTLGARKQIDRRKVNYLPWRIGIQNPLANRGDYIGVVPVTGKCVVTSGIYERYFESGGKKYHHILSTKTGYPVENELLSVTIVSDNSTIADALSTSVFAMGYTQGRALVDSFPNADAVFVFADRSIRITSGLDETFALNGNEFRLVY